MSHRPESLDPLTLPLLGERLIEASAGTGKTFTIAARSTCVCCWDLAGRMPFLAR